MFTVQPTQADVLGSVSLIIWLVTLMVVVKYACIVLFAEDRGEGGALAHAPPLSGREPSCRYSSDIFGFSLELLATTFLETVDGTTYRRMALRNVAAIHRLSISACLAGRQASPLLALTLPIQLCPNEACAAATWA